MRGREGGEERGLKDSVPVMDVGWSRRDELTAGGGRKQPVPEVELARARHMTNVPACCGAVCRRVFFAGGTALVALLAVALVVLASEVTANPVSPVLICRAAHAARRSCQLREAAVPAWRAAARQCAAHVRRESGISGC